MEKFEKELDQINIKHIILKIRSGDRSDESVISLLRKFGKTAESVELYGPNNIEFYRGTLLEKLIKTARDFPFLTRIMINCDLRIRNDLASYAVIIDSTRNQYSKIK